MMQLQTFKMRTRLKLGLGALLFLVVFLGGVSFWQSAQMHEQIETLYNHPLQVRWALGELKADLFAIERNRMMGELGQNAHYQDQALAQLEILKQRYLGPPNEVEALRMAYWDWMATPQESSRQRLLEAWEVVDTFARAKGDSLYQNSQDLNNTLNLQLLLLVGFIVVLSLIINRVLLQGILGPLAELTAATRAFHDGNLGARSSYSQNDEFLVLSDSFNTLAQKIQAKMELDEKLASLSQLMLRENDADSFFRATLQALLYQTGSQMAALYVLSSDKKSYQLRESIGMEKDKAPTFDAEQKEGEFGAALATRQIQHLKDIPTDTRFSYLSVSGRLLPREILTVPVVVADEVAAILSLASLSPYSAQALDLIDQILLTLSARFGGILSSHQLRELFKTLEKQKRELEAQKSELSAQASELGQQNTELERQKGQLSEVSRLKTSFLSNMSHELRTPLNSVIALSSVLHRRLEGQIPEEEYGYLGVIERNGKQLLTLINDLLDIAKIESGREQVHKSRFDVLALIDEVVDLLQPQAGQKGLALVHHRQSQPTFITSDADRCRHILQNLVGNAVKFTLRGSVEISTRWADPTLEILVTDTGIGMTADQIPIIFDEFRQGDSGTSRQFGGTGLGLAIVKKNADLIGAQVSVQSTPGQGSTFTLGLPQPPSAVPGKTVLLVEDSEPAIIQLKDILEDCGYYTLVARNGEEALRIIDQTIPDAMILDLMMPGIDGFEVLQTLRNAEPTAHIPVLILTAKHITKEELLFLKRNKEELLFLKRNNVHQLIQKGDVNRQELLDAVAAMVGGHEK